MTSIRRPQNKVGRIVLVVIPLQTSLKHLFVFGVASGEKKRVSIAMELLSEPSVLILDEPTSGLDSTLACELLNILKRLTNYGRIVICSIYQPTSQVGRSLTTSCRV